MSDNTAVVFHSQTLLGCLLWGQLLETNNDAIVQDNDKETLTDKATLELQAKNTNITL